MSPMPAPTQTPLFTTARDDRSANPGDVNRASARRFEMTAPAPAARPADEPREDVNRFEGFF